MNRIANQIKNRLGLRPPQSVSLDIDHYAVQIDHK